MGLNTPHTRSLRTLLSKQSTPMPHISRQIDVNIISKSVLLMHNAHKGLLHHSPYSFHSIPHRSCHICENRSKRCKRRFCTHHMLHHGEVHTQRSLHKHWHCNDDPTEIPHILSLIGTLRNRFHRTLRILPSICILCSSGCCILHRTQLTYTLRSNLYCTVRNMTRDSCHCCLRIRSRGASCSRSK